MPKNKFDIPEPGVNPLAIRKAYFSRAFWDQWEAWSQEKRDAYVLGYITELERTVMRLTHELDQLKELVATLPDIDHALL
jgi:hypothetical protein